MSTNTVQEAYKAAVQADNAWQAELTHQFRWNAGDVRYTKKGEGAPGSLLNELYCAFMVATDAWRLAINEQREGASK